MSGCLESLANNLEVLPSLPTAMKWRGNWDVNEQYYINDVVRSNLNGVEYILTGIGFQRGGLDPADLTNTTGFWTSLSGITNSSVSPTVVVSATPNTYTVSTANLANAPANSRWLITFNGERTLTAGTNTANDVDKWAFTSVDGDAFEVELIPSLIGGPPATNNTHLFGVSGVVQTGATAGAITVTALFAGTAWAYTGNAKITYVRLV